MSAESGPRDAGGPETGAPCLALVKAFTQLGLAASGMEAGRLIVE